MIRLYLLNFVGAIVLALTLAPLTHGQQPLGSNQITGVSGVGPTLVTTTGTQSTGHCVTIDANGNHVDSGAACTPAPTITSIMPSTANRGAMALRENQGVFSFGPIPSYAKVLGYNRLIQATNPGSSGTDLASTSRVPFTTINAVSNLRLLFSNTQGLSGTGEVAGSSSGIFKATIETGTVTLPVTVNGQTTFTLDPNATLTASDPVGVYIPAATTFYVRCYGRVPAPPTSGAATAVTGGALAASTTYYYKITTVDNNLESGPSTEFSAATGTSTLMLNLTWTAPANATPSFYKIYRSTATGTEVLIAQIPAPATGYNDSGYGQVVSATTPPAARGVYFSGRLPTGYSSQGSGNNADLTGSTGAISANVGPSNAYGIFPYVVLGDDTAVNVIIGEGDSIEQGTGIGSSSGLGSGQSMTQNWFDGGVQAAGGFYSVNMSVGGALASTWTTNSPGLGVRARDAMLNFGDIVITDNGHNDITAAATWTQVAQYNLNFALVSKRRGLKFYITTLTPYTTSTDDWLTTTNQTTTSYETARQNYNSWVRGGSQVSGGVPVISGGTASPYIDGYFDLAGPVEVNSSNVVTPNGGYWLAPTTALFTGLVLTGTPTLTTFTVGSATFTTNTMQGYAIRMTSGAANNQPAFINNAASTTSLTLYANPLDLTGSTGVDLTTTPAAGDTFNVYKQYTADGIHPSYTAHLLIGTSFATWIPANLSTF